MTISFLARAAEAWRCANGPWPCASTGPRGRWPSDGHWAEQCQACVDKMVACIQRFKAGGDRLWFLGKRKKETT